MSKSGSSGRSPFQEPMPNPDDAHAAIVMAAIEKDLGGVNISIVDDNKKPKSLPALVGESKEPNPLLDAIKKDASKGRQCGTSK